MNRFCKAMSHLNSTQIDEKIKFLDKQLKKTGIVLEAGPAMSTANIYQTFRYDFTPGLPEIEGYVPDSTGFSDGTSTQDANGGDESDSNTWENGWNNISDMQNSNDLNGETNRNISFTPDLSGWTPAAQTNKSSENPIGSGFGGVATWSISSGIGGGRTIGTLTAGNTYVGMVVPENTFSTYNYPGYPRTNIVYAWYSDSEYAAAKNIADAYEDNKLKGGVTRKVWVPYSTATSHGGPTYDEYTGAKKTTTITDYDGNSVTKQWKLKSITILNGARQNYISQTKRLPSSSTTLLTQHSLDDPSFYAGNPNKFMDFLKDSLNVGDKAFEYLKNLSGIDAEDNTATMIDKTLNNIIDTLGSTNPVAKLISQLPVFDYSREIMVSMMTNQPVNLGNDDVSEADKRNYINRIPDAAFNQIPINASEENYADGNFYVDANGMFQSNLGPNGEQNYVVDDRTSGISGATTVAGAIGDMAQMGANNRIASRGKNMTQMLIDDDGNPVLVINDYAYINNKSKDKDEIPSTLGKLNPKQWVSNQLHKISDILSGRTEGEISSVATKGQGNKERVSQTTKADMTTPNTGGLMGIPPNIRGVSNLKVTIPFDKWPADKKKIWNERKADKGEFFSNTGTYTFGDDKLSASPDPGPAPVKPGDIPTQPSSPYLPGKSPYKLAGGLPYTSSDDPFGADDSGDDWEDDSDIPGDFPFDFTKKNKNKKNKSKVQVTHYEPQGELISEGWESPKYTYVDKDQQKRWFKEKDIQPVYPKKAPPKMVKGWHPKFVVKLDTPIPIIKVSKKDLQKSHIFKADEVEELMQLVKNLNDYIKRNPDHLAYARVRYPKHDPRLAALNYKLDMQLAAADEYVETRFPENERLFDRLMRRTKESIKLTDPKTYENDNGKLITFNKLARIGNDYQPRKIKVKKKPKMSQGKLFLLPDRKKKDDILKDKMAVLDNQMKKTMPDA